MIKEYNPYIVILVTKITANSSIKI